MMVGFAYRYFTSTKFHSRRTFSSSISSAPRGAIIKSIIWRLTALFVLPLCIWLGFAAIYFFNASQISFSNPNKAQNLNSFLETFFDDVCRTGRNPAIITKRFDGCTYQFGLNGIVTESGNEPLYSTKDISFSFASYVDKILRIKYKTTRVWFKNLEILQG